MLLLGCSSGAPADDASPGDDAVADVADVAGPVPEPETFDFDLISSCDEAEGVMAPYIQGLTQMEGNVVDEYGASCTWTMPEGNTDWANTREVSLGIVSVSEGDLVPDIAALEALDGFEGISNEWLTAKQGVAYTASMSTGVVGGIVTTVWTPEYEVTVGGGHWEGTASLDGAAGLEVAQGLLG